jgi:hypothetical protein
MDRDYVRVEKYLRIHRTLALVQDAPFNPLRETMTDSWDEVSRLLAKIEWGRLDLLSHRKMLPRSQSAFLPISRADKAPDKMEASSNILQSGFG